VPFGKKDGTTITNPTVAEMARFDAQWGLPPKPESTPGSSSTHTATITPSTTPVETAPPDTLPAIPPTLR
jgi:hypothetical protein